MMYNPNDPQRKLRRPQPPITTTDTAQGSVPLAGPLAAPPALEVPSVQERMMRQGVTPAAEAIPMSQTPLATQPNLPMRPRTDTYRPAHLDSMEQYDPIAKARGDYIAPGRDIIGEELATPGRSFRQTLKTAGLGALQGLATGGIGGAIGGALGGAILGTASPRAARGYEFEMMQRPRLEEDLQRQMMLRKAQEELETRNIGQAYTQEQMLGLRQGREAKAAMLPYEIEQAQSRSEAYRAQAGRYNRPPVTPPRTPRTQIVTTRDAQGRPVQRAVDPEEMLRTGQALPVYERPRVGRGGGGGGEATLKTAARGNWEQFVEAEAQLRGAAQLYNQLQAQPPEDDPDALNKAKENYLRAFTNAQAKAEVLASYPEFEVYNTREAFNPASQTPWPYVKRRGK